MNLSEHVRGDLMVSTRLESLQASLDQIIHDGFAFGLGIDRSNSLSTKLGDDGLKLALHRLLHQNGLIEQSQSPDWESIELCRKRAG